MPTESDLRNQFRGPEGDGERIDAGEIIRRAHRRRAPKVVAATAGALLIVAAVAVPVAGLGIARPSGGSASSAGSTGSAHDAGTPGRSEDLRVPATPEEKACTSPAPAPTDDAVAVSVDTADATVGGPVSGAVVLRGSASDARVTGPVSLTVLRGDTALWSGTADVGTPRLALTAGGEARLTFSVAVVDCASGAAVPAGRYRIVAALPVSVDGATAERIGGEGVLRIG